MPEQIRFLNKLASGAIAGITGTCIIYPIDFLKTKIQTDVHKASARTVIKEILRNEGPLGLYKGLLANLVGVTPEKAIKLAVNDLMRGFLASRYSHGRPENLPPMLGMLAGATAGLCQVIATNPMEMVKIQMQVATGRQSTLQVVKELGLRGMYKGSLACLSRDIPFSIIFFQSSATFKSFGSNGKEPTLFTVFASGLAAGTLAAYLVTPMDVVKTRLQVMARSNKIDFQYNGIIDCFKNIISNEGISALYKGGIQRCMIIAPLFGISLLVYEAQQRFFIKLAEK